MTKVLSKKDCDSSKVSGISAKLMANPDIAKLIGELSACTSDASDLVKGLLQASINAGIRPSTGTIGDSYDNALAETVNGLYKTELIYSRAWRSCSEVEWATLNWVYWWNNHRLHESLGYATPEEIIASYNQHRVSQLTPV